MKKKLSKLAFTALILSSIFLFQNNAFALSARLFGLPLGIEFDEAHHVNRVLVFVNPGWLNSDTFSLGITITGVNHSDREHGYQEVLISDLEVFAISRNEALVFVDWTTDTFITSSPELYTVRVQILVNGTAKGDDMYGHWEY